jgi:hypothetical protein
MKLFELKISTLCTHLSEMTGMILAFKSVGESLADTNKREPIDDEFLTLAKDMIGKIIIECQNLQIPFSKMYAERLRNAMASGISEESFISRCRELMNRIEDELTSTMLFTVSSDKQYLLKDLHLFGDLVYKVFPSTRYDIEEAGKCLAFDRKHACVYHLMRGLEVGLYALARDLNISKIEENWNNAIEQIEKAIKVFEKYLPNTATAKEKAEHKAKHQFYSDCATHFRYIKDAWRNHNAHSRRGDPPYSDEKVIQIFDNVRGFMQTLATKIQEIP